MNLHISASPDEVLENLAVYFVETATAAISENGRFSVALSGGSSPKKLHEILASRYAGSLDWSKVYFFLGDERYVPLDDTASNFRMAKETIFEPLGINDDQVFPVNTSLLPEDAATDYMGKIAGYFKNEPPVFDLILLGLGDNSHTASLFPHTAILHETGVDVKAVYLQDQQVYRISFTAPLINLANKIAFLVYGDAKAEAVFHIIEEGEGTIDEYPARLIDPVDGELDWFLDKAAASRL